MTVDQRKGIANELRVLLVDLSKKFGGASVRALSLAAHLKADMAAIAGLENSPVVRIAEKRNIPVRIVGKHRGDPLIPFRLRKIIQNEGFQIVDTQNIQSKFWGSLTALMTSVAFVATLNSLYDDEHGGSLKGKLYARIDRWTNFRTDRYIAVSEPIRKSLINDGISESFIDLVTNGVDVGEGFATDDPRIIRRQVGLPDDAFMIVSVGRLVWAKGHEDLISAFASISEKIPNAYACILGEGVLHSFLSQHIKTVGLEGKVFLLGHREPEEVLRFLRASNVFALSSRSEGVPFALLEAAAQGLPILATRCGGIPDILTDRVDALLVPVGDIQAVGSGIKELFMDRQFAQRLGAEARNKMMREYSIQKQVNATWSTYQKTLAHKRLLVC